MGRGNETERVGGFAAAYTYERHRSVPEPVLLGRRGELVEDGIALLVVRSADALMGAMSADEIRAVREFHRLTQAELAKLLPLGLSTVSRWEAGRNVQAGAMDVLIRLLRDVPGTLEYLKTLAA